MVQGLGLAYFLPSVPLKISAPALATRERERRVVRGGVEGMSSVSESVSGGI